MRNSVRWLLLATMAVLSILAAACVDARPYPDPSLQAWAGAAHAHEAGSGGREPSDILHRPVLAKKRRPMPLGVLTLPVRGNRLPAWIEPAPSLAYVLRLSAGFDATVLPPSPPNPLLRLHPGQAPPQA
ncbi:hypothetical protein HNR76_001810 [Pseudoxanthomonas broegbernensis]|nr:hypothetical protein [Pseudoxanthomonas broegbernensis]MBB6065252.1 hypothetical protein [Pseudoxanthomonas broegbernensis]